MSEPSTRNAAEAGEDGSPFAEPGPASGRGTERSPGSADERRRPADERRPTADEGRPTADEGRPTADDRSHPDDEPVATGTLFVMIVFLAMLAGMWLIVYLMLLGR